MSLKITSSFAYKPAQDKPGVLGVKIVGTNPVHRPNHHADLVDTSGSMAYGRIAAVKKCTEAKLNLLKEGDTYSLVGFNSKATVIFAKEKITGDPAQKQAMIQAINKLCADGGTNLEEGINAMKNAVEDGPPVDAFTVLTDGQVNAGKQDTDDLYNTFPKQVPIYTIGTGTDYNDNMLKAFSERSNASHSFIEEDVSNAGSGTEPHNKREINLAVAIGNMVGEIQTQVASECNLIFHAGLNCLEFGSKAGSGKYSVGTLAADKAAWIVLEVPFGLESSGFQFKYKLGGGTEETLTFTPVDGECDPLEVEAEMLRCKNAIVTSTTTELLRSNNLPKAKALLTEALAFIATSAAATQPRAIVMKAQLEDLLEGVNKAIDYATQNHCSVDDARTPGVLLYRSSAIAGNYATQRGVTPMDDGTTPGVVFCSPAQMQASQQMVDQCTQGSTVV